MQFLVHFLFLLDIYHQKKGKNPIGVPPNATIEFLSCPLRGLIIGVVIETDISKSLNVITKVYDEASVISSFGKRSKPKFLWFLSIL